MKNAQWVEISLTVNRELSEAVAEVLSRFIPGGVVVEFLGVSEAEPHGYHSASMRVSGYLPINEKLESIRHQILEALWYLGRIRSLPEPEFRLIEETNWMETWKRNYHPIPVGESLIVLPAWIENPQPSRTPIRINPGMAFGTGAHPSTQLSLEILERESQRIKGGIIDMGCGSGILSIAAAKLGMKPVLGVDVDSKALEWARKNAIFNDVEDHIEFETGSVKEILSRKFKISQAPVVIANILSHILIRLIDAGLTELVAPEGRLILSGILAEKESEMREALKEHQLIAIHHYQLEDWVALVAKKSDDSLPE